MKPLLFFLFLFFNSLYPVLSQSNLLETVKKNPNEAKNLCNKFREFNSKGISASSDKAIEYVSNKKKLIIMKPFLFLLFLFSNSLYPVFSQSNLLESVKKNPNEARNLCNKFREFNSKGISASSDKAIEYVSNKKKLTPVNAEIFSIYVIGLHCPDII